MSLSFSYIRANSSDKFAQQILPLQSLVHVNLFSVICLLFNSLLTQTIPTRQTLLSLTLISRNALAMTKSYISHTENASPISLQMSVWLCRTFLLQASISCEKNSSDEQITLHAWCWSWHLVTKENYLHKLNVLHAFIVRRDAFGCQILHRCKAQDDVTRHYFNSQTQIICLSTSEPFLVFQTQIQIVAFTPNLLPVKHQIWTAMVHPDTLHTSWHYRINNVHGWDFRRFAHMWHSRPAQNQQ